MTSLAVKAIIELLGTLLFVHSIGLIVHTYSLSNPTLVAIPIGFTLMVLIFTWGHVSGGHFNPAVSCGMWIAGKIDIITCVIYMLFQIIGGICGGVIAATIVKSDKVDDPWPVVDVKDSWEGLWTEFVFTFLLVSAVANTAGTSAVSYKDNSFFALAIGVSVTVGIASAGGLSGGAFNPAVLFGVNVGAQVYGKTVPEAGVWALVLLLQLVGGFTAGLLFCVTEMIETDTFDEPSNDSSTEYDGDISTDQDRYPHKPAHKYKTYKSKHEMVTPGGMEMPPRSAGTYKKRGHPYTGEW